MKEEKPITFTTSCGLTLDEIKSEPLDPETQSFYDDLTHRGIQMVEQGYNQYQSRSFAVKIYDMIRGFVE